MMLFLHQNQEKSQWFNKYLKLIIKNRIQIVSYFFIYIHYLDFPSTIFSAGAKPGSKSEPVINFLNAN